MKLAERDFVARRRKGELPAIALFYGAEQGLIQQAVDEIWRTVLIGEEEDGPMDMATFHAGEVDGEKLHNACRARPFILSHRLVHLKLVEEATPAVKEVILAYLKRPSPSTRLLLSGGNLEAAHPFRKQCESHEHAWCVPFYALEGEKFRQWLVDQLRRDGYSIVNDALLMLCEKLEGNTLAAMGELDKLKLFMGNERQVQVADLLAVVGETSAISGFALADAALAGRVAPALHILDRLLEGGDEPLMLLGLITQRIRRIIQGKSMLERGEPLKSVAGKLRIFWKEEESFQSQCRQWQEEKLADALLLCLESDAALKGEGITPQLTMEQLIMGLANLYGVFAPVRR